MGREKVTIIGSGNWASAICIGIGNNCAANPDVFEKDVNMWVFEEQVNGRNLSEIINTEHENVKYMPGVTLPSNIIAVPDIAEAARGATILVIVLPHQFLGKVLPPIGGVVAGNCRAISLIKGIEFEDGKVKLISQMITDALSGMGCSVLMGANVAKEVAEGQYCETTIGVKTASDGPILKKLFETPTLKVGVLESVAGPELCGALKNVVALAAGFCDGLGYGYNTKAAIMRIGLLEMKQFADTYFPGCDDATYLESCGVADLITTCFGGRNVRCAVEFVKTGKSFDVLEAEMLNGQKLQGTITAKDVHTVLTADGNASKFPLFEVVYSIAFEGADAKSLFKIWPTVQSAL